jgi:hypothetical protein
MTAFACSAGVTIGLPAAKAGDAMNGRAIALAIQPLHVMSLLPSAGVAPGCGRPKAKR